MSVNLDGAFLGCKHAIAHMMERGGGADKQYVLLCHRQ